MENKTQHGYLLIADISGYTSYVAATELEHAQAILTELLETLIKELTTLTTLSKLEGDAVFTYVPESKVPRGETILELVESTYVAFKDKQDVMRRHTSCTCNACRAIPSLDLKILAHHGDYFVQHVAGINELVGSDVNLVHRLLKNHVGEATGWRGYALYSAACMSHMGAKPDDLRAMTESYEHLGDVQIYCMDLLPRYKALTENRRVYLKPEDAMVVLTHEFPAPPPVVWQILNDPALRSQLMPGRKWSAATRPGGRTAPGASNHCAHGKGGLNVETILDWRPFEYITTQQVEGQKIMQQTIAYEAIHDGKGTRVSDRLVAQMPLPRWLGKRIFNYMMFKMYHYDELYETADRLVREYLSHHESD